MKNRKPPKIICHRGASHELPENSFEAIHAAMELPVHGVEFDVDLTKDGVPILIHQETAVPNEAFDGLMLGTRDEGRSWTHLYNWSELSHFDIGSWKGKNFSHIRFTRLDEVLSYNWGDKLAVVELKNPYFYKGMNRDFAERILSVTIPIIKSFIARGGNVQLLSFDTDIIELARPQLPNNEIVLAIDPCFASTPDESTMLAANLGADSTIVMDQWIFNEPRWVENCGRHKLGLWAFELSPDSEALKRGGHTIEQMELNWANLYNQEIIGFHSDRAADCYRFYKNYRPKALSAVGF